MKTKSILYYLMIFIVFIIIAIISIINFLKQPHIESTKSLTILGDLKFKGRVISSKIYNYGGREYRLVCLKLDSCNKKNLYVLKDFCAIKIKNRIATISVGGDQTYFRVDYVTLDASNNIETFHYQNGEIRTGEIYLGEGGLTENDMNYCQ